MTDPVAEAPHQIVADLQRRLDEALAQQTATADVLKIISRASIDLETVLDTLVKTVARLCRADQALMYRLRDDKYHLVAEHGLSAEAAQFGLAFPLVPDRGTATGRAGLEGRPVHIPDVLEDQEYNYADRSTREPARYSAFRYYAKRNWMEFSQFSEPASSLLLTRKLSSSPPLQIRL